MSLRKKLDKLTEKDIWTLLLFVLYKTNNVPEYSSLSQLSFILDKDSLFKLCEYFGGTTITIPTMDELEILIYSLLLYQYVDIEKIQYDEALSIIAKNSNNKFISNIATLYKKIKNIIGNYNFNE